MVLAGGQIPFCHRKFCLFCERHSWASLSLLFCLLHSIAFAFILTILFGHYRTWVNYTMGLEWFWRLWYFVFHIMLYETCQNYDPSLYMLWCFLGIVLLVCWRGKFFFMVSSFSLCWCLRNPWNNSFAFYATVSFSLCFFIFQPVRV
jgi:hypothetical protein